MMKVGVLWLLSGWFSWALAHPCPYDWNIQFSKRTEIRGENLADFVQKLNDAVRKQSNRKVSVAMVLENKPDHFTKVPADSPFEGQMDALIRRYGVITAPLIKIGVFCYGTAPVEMDFPANFPIACLLSALFSDEDGTYLEQKGGARVLIQQRLECRAYKIKPSLLKVAKENEEEGRVPEKVKPVEYTFARYSGMRWQMDVAGKEGVQSILSGVVCFLPKQKVILAIETKRGHEMIERGMSERGYIDAKPRVEPALESISDPFDR